MSTVIHTKTMSGNSRAFVANWVNLAMGDEGEAIDFSQFTDKSVQVVGLFGSGGAIALEGSNDGTNWAVLTDPQGNDLNITSSKIEMVTEATLKVRPRVIGGDGTTDLSVHILMKE